MKNGASLPWPIRYKNWKINIIAFWRSGTVHKSRAIIALQIEGDCVQGNNALFPWTWREIMHYFPGDNSSFPKNVKFSIFDKFWLTLHVNCGNKYQSLPISILQWLKKFKIWNEKFGKTLSFLTFVCVPTSKNNNVITAFQISWFRYYFPLNSLVRYAHSIREEGNNTFITRSGRQ